MRTFKTVLLAVSAATLIPAAALAAPAEKASPVYAAGVQAKDSQKVCRNIETTGTRMAKRACHTREEWKKIEKLQG